MSLQRLQALLLAVWLASLSSWAPRTLFLSTFSAVSRRSRTQEDQRGWCGISAGVPRSSALIRHARVDGPWGVLPESPAPLVELEESDPLLERLIRVVQAADKRRGIDISAFWINRGWDISVIVTALSRPQLQTIAEDIDFVLRHEFRLKRRLRSRTQLQNIRQEAQHGWCCMVYDRMIVHVMTPTQRVYYNIEKHWREDNQDYEKIELDELLREDGFGRMMTAKALADDSSSEKGSAPPEPPVNPDVVYEVDEEDPFWS